MSYEFAYLSVQSIIILGPFFHSIKVLIRHTCSYPVLLPEKSQSSLGKSNIYDDIRFMAMLQSHIAGALTKQGPIRMIRVPRMDKSYIID